METRALALAALLAAARAFDNVSVVRTQLALEQLHTIVVDANTEYIMDFIPNLEQSQWPSRVWLSSDGGDTARPLLVTHRQRAGAGTWQVPVWSDGRLLFEFERQLCPDDSVEDGPSDCVDTEENERARGWFSLHAVSACARALTVRVRAAPARDWRISFQSPLSTEITPAQPRVHYYMFEEGQQQVRLIVASEDDVCATIAIQNYTCPIIEKLDDIAGATIRMTVQRSGAVQLSRNRFPRGFYVVSVAHETDEVCEGEAPERPDWLWQAALFGEPEPGGAAPRLKRLTIDTRPALSRAQYAVAGVLALAFFLAFYVAFGLLVLLQQWPRFFKVVRPKAVLKDTSNSEPGLESQVDAVGQLPSRRRRRGSDATFDSSDNSDSDESDAETPRPDGDVTARPPANGNAATPPADTSARAGAGADVTPRPPASGSTRGGAGADVTPRPPANGDATTPPGDASAGADVTARPGGGAGEAPAQGGGSDPSRAPGADVVDGGITRADTMEQQAPSGNGTNGPTPPPRSHPYGLPTKLRVDALARRKARVIRARSDRYLQTLYTVAVFYALPVVQFVVAFQIVMNVSGSLDMCYYNFLCAHPAGQLSDFNHVFSNLGYLLLGALFMLQLRRRQRNRKKEPKDEEYGIPAHYGLLASLGAGMMVVALLSASYHICPNRLNFQFDTAFMYVLSVLSMVKIYQSRHPDVNARAHATFGVLAVLIAIVVWGVLGGGALFWGVFTVLHVFTFLLLSLRIYYIGQFRLEKETFQWAARELRALPAQGLRPLYSARLVLLLIANAVNWAFALYGLFTQSTNFASHLLFVLLANTMVYILFYLAMKLLHGERPRWYAWCFLAGAAGAWAPALYFFTSGSSSWSSTPAQSRHRNHECLVLQFYDAHDLWHMLSAAALFLTFNAMLTWDDGLAAVPRNQIAVF